MTILEKALVEIKLGTYGVAAASALKDPSLLPQIQNYKRQVASRLLPLGKSDIVRKVPDAEYLVSRKIDGEFTGLVYTEGELFTINPGGRVRIGLPWQDEAKRLFDAAGISSAIIAGELYVTNTQDRRPRVHDVVSVVRQPASVEELARIKFAVFDWIMLEGQPWETNYAETWSKIQSVFGQGELIHPVETVSLKGHRDVETQFAKWVEQDSSEGIVVRSDSAGNFKVKPRHSIDAVVIGFTESTEERMGMLHDLLLAIARRDGALQVLGRVGGGFSDDDRRTMLSDLKDMIVESEYAEVNSDHVAYQMVRPEWVVEINCLDFIAQNTRGGPVNRMVLNWNSRDHTFEVVRRLPLVSVISPQFVRRREDKSANSTDIRIDQITDIVPIGKSDIVASEMALPKSQLLKREVYTKTLKGEMMVRKFLLWKTNKPTDSDEFPAFVIHYTDFSPNRKVPLTREVRVSNSETQILALWSQFKDDYIKKGWSLHHATGND